jgi:hypothetical protein
MSPLRQPHARPRRDVTARTHAIKRPRLEAHDRVDLTSRRTHRRTVTDARFHAATKDKSDAATSARDALAAAALSDFLGAVSMGRLLGNILVTRFGAATVFR